MTRARADLLVLFAALIWGVAFYFQKAAMDHIGPFLFLGLRSAIACVALAPLAWRERPAGRADARPVWHYAALGGLAFFTGGALQQVGMVTATVTNTSFLTALYVVLTPFLLWLLRHERPGARVWIAAVVAFIGIWYLGGGGIGAFSTRRCADRRLLAVLVALHGHHRGIGESRQPDALHLPALRPDCVAGASACLRI